MAVSESACVSYYDRFAMSVTFDRPVDDTDATVINNVTVTGGLYLTYSRSHESSDNRASWFKRAFHGGSHTDLYLRFDEYGGFWYIGPCQHDGSVAYAYNPQDSLVPPVSNWLMPVEGHEDAVHDIMAVRPDDPNRRSKPWIKPAKAAGNPAAGDAADAIDNGEGGLSAGGGKRGGGKGGSGKGVDTYDADEPEVWEDDPSATATDSFFILFFIIIFFKKTNIFANKIQSMICLPSPR